MYIWNFKHVPIISIQYYYIDIIFGLRLIVYYTYCLYFIFTQNIRHVLYCHVLFYYNNFDPQS